MLKNRNTVETRNLLRTLKKHGFTPLAVYDEDADDWIRTETQAAAITECTAVDVARLQVKHAKCRAVLLLVYGNSPGELVADYSIPSDAEAAAALDAATSEHFDTEGGYLS